MQIWSVWGALMEDYLDSSSDTQASPRRSSDILSDGLARVRLRAGQTDRQRELLAARNLALGGQIEAMRKRMGHIEPHVQKEHSPPPTSEADALRNEIESLLRERDELRQQLAIAAEQTSAPSREVDLEAELQAARQQTALLRKTIQEKDHALEDLAAQCQSLEDVLEDRNREMDHLTREIEHSQGGMPSLDPNPRAGQTLQLAVEPYALSATQGAEYGGIFDATHLLYSPQDRFPWKSIGLLLGGLLAGMLGVVLWWRPPTSSSATILSVAQVPKQLPTLSEPSLEKDETAPLIGSETDSVQSSAPGPSIPSTAPARPPIELRIVQDRLRSGGKGPLLVQIPPGRFAMGSKPGLAGPGEQPLHEVRLKAFYIGRHEITFNDYDRFARATRHPLPNDAGFGRGNRPVINVSWNDAQDYVRWLSSETRQRYRLPSEAEWEYAARGGSASRYWWGFAPQAQRAICFACGTPWDNRSTAPVGSLRANAFGLYDTSGNVMEWVQDCHHINYQNAPSDGSPWLGDDCNQHMVRGGAFNKPISSARSNARFHLATAVRLNMLGFRVARD